MDFPSELTTLLKTVSRSFYLSLHLLPKAVRGEMSLAYLLARASDSIADSATVAAAERLELLQQFTPWETPPAGFFACVARLQVPHVGEQQLLHELATCFRLAGQLPEAGQDILRTLMKHILHGQSLDLQRFPGKLQTASELEEYTFLVAGCVGEFWSDMLAWKIPNWTRQDPAAMRHWGRTYGQGLQLVNILRDLPGDLAEGREYLPGGDTMLARRDHWASAARTWLQAGERYTSGLCGWRLRLTADLPWRLGMATLEALPVGEMVKVKVPRSRVRSLLLGSLRRGFLGW